jgi:hypothetical protein
MKRLLLAAAFCAAATPAFALFDSAAPGLVQIVDPTAPSVPLGTVSHPLNTTGTFSGSVGGFPAGAGGVIGTPVTAVTTVTVGSTQSLPAGTEVVATNVGSNMAFCQLGATASANSQPIAPSGGWFGFTVGSATQITCVTTTSTTTVNLFGGTGLPTGTGGGGGGGGAFTWPGTAGVAAGGTSAGGNTMPYVNAYLAGTLPAFASTPTVNLGTLGGAATAANQEVTAAGTSASSAQAIQGVVGGVPQPTIYGPDTASVTGTITANDTGTTSCVATAAGQTICTGTPTPAAVVSTAVGPVACLGVSSFITSGTPVATLSTEFSPDNVNWLPRGLFLDGKNAPIWINNATGGVFSGQTPAAGMKFYRVRATSFSSSGTFTITINQSQAGCVQYSGNLPTAGNGSGSTASVNVQGAGGAALPVGVNQTQQAGATLGAPAAIGVSATGNIPAFQGVTGGVPVPVTASLGGFQPSSSGARMTPMAVGTTDTSVALPTGAVVVVSNVGLTNIMYCNVNSLAAQTSDQPIAPGGGWFAFTIPVGPTLLHCISPAGGTTANGVGGSGLATGTGGGGGASGGGGNVFQANLFANGSTSSATTTQQIAASGSTVVYLVNYAVQTDAAAGGTGTFQIVTGTGTNCATSQVALTPVWSFPAGQGVQEGSIGVLGVSAAGAELCTKTTTGNQVNWRVGVVQQ